MLASDAAKQRRRVKELVKAFNFQDKTLDEEVFTAEAEPIFEILRRQFGTLHPDAVKKFYALTATFERGEVMKDGRGRGTQQKVLKPKRLTFYTEDPK